MTTNSLSDWLLLCKYCLTRVIIIVFKYVQRKGTKFLIELFVTWPKSILLLPFDPLDFFTQRKREIADNWLELYVDHRATATIKDFEFVLLPETCNFSLHSVSFELLTFAWIYDKRKEFLDFDSRRFVLLVFSNVPWKIWHNKLFNGIHDEFSCT